MIKNHNENHGLVEQENVIDVWMSLKYLTKRPNLGSCQVRKNTKLLNKGTNKAHSFLKFSLMWYSANMCQGMGQIKLQRYCPYSQAVDNTINNEIINYM